MRRLTLLFVWFFFIHKSHANCTEWSVPEKIGTLDTRLVPEASGIAWSQSHKKLFHVNDSGDGSHFYVSELDGKNLKGVRVSGFIAKDVEDLTLGPCAYSNNRCLFIADIGDNKFKRKTLSIALVEIKEIFPELVQSSHVFQFRVGSESVDAEGLAFHPKTHDLYILTKESHLKKRLTTKPQLMKIAKEVWSKKSSEIRTAVAVAELPIELGVGAAALNRMPTSLDIDATAEMMLVLTYSHIFLYKMGDFHKPVTHIPLPDLRQWEAATFIDSHTIVLSAESSHVRESPIYRTQCMTQLSPAPQK